MHGQEYEYIYEDFSDLLDDEFVHSISMDKKGNLWGSTRQGVFIYDGVTIEQVNEFDAFNLVKYLEFDTHGMLWFQIEKSDYNTESYVQVYNPETSSFLEVEDYVPEIDTLLHLDKVISFHKNNEGQLWLIQNKSIFLYSDQSIRFKHTFNNQVTSFNFFSNHRSILSKKKGRQISDIYNLLTGNKIAEIPGSYAAYASLIYNNEPIINAYIKPGKRFELMDAQNDSLSNNFISSVQQLETKDYIFHSFHNQIQKFDKNTKKLALINTSNSPLDGKKIAKMTGNEDVIWLQTNAGLFRMYRKKIIFNHQLSDSKYRVRKFLQLSDDKLLIFTDKYLAFYNRTTGAINVKKERYTGSNAFLWNDNTLHIGTMSGGFIRYHVDHIQESIDTCCTIVAAKNNFYTCSYDADSLILFGSDHRITYQIKGSSEFLTLRDTLPSNISDIIPAQDAKNFFLLGDPGLFLLNMEHKKIRLYDELSAFHISDIRPTKHQENAYWISTKFDGLMLWHIKDGILQHWTKQDGLSLNNIHSAYQDNRNRLWMSTDRGINVLDITTNEISILTRKDGLVENEMNRFAHLLMEDGTLFFGSQQGFFSFDPNEYEFPQTNQAVTFKYLKYIVTHAAKPRKIELNQLDQHSIYIKRHYINPKLILSPALPGEKVEIRYRFSEDDTWAHVLKNEIPLNNISKSEDLLISRQLGFNSWSIPEIYKIEYQLPLYRRLWFIISSILIIAGLIILYLMYINYRRKKVNDRIRQEIKMRTKELSENNLKLRASNQLNDQIFSIIGHDLRSPIISLNHISDTFDYLLVENNIQGLKKLSQSIDKNSSKLLNLVDRLLDWARAQRRAINTSSHVDISEEIRSCIELMKDLALDKDIKISYDLKSSIFTETDPESFKIIVRNLIHNAIKFSPPESTISIQLFKDQLIHVHIIDAGIGFPNDVIYHFNNHKLIHSRQGTRGEIGTGMGLSICKELAEKLGGTLSIGRNDDIGSTARLAIPKR